MLLSQIIVTDKKYEKEIILLVDHEAKIVYK